MSGTEGTGVYLKGACAPTNHTFKALEFVLFNNWALTNILYFGLHDIALLVSVVNILAIKYIFINIMN